MSCLVLLQYHLTIVDPICRTAMSLIHIKDVRSKLIRWGKENYKNYPWRGDNDPWKGILSEILLQRTNVGHVEAYFSEILAKFPNPQIVLSANKSELKFIEDRFGLDRRANTIIAVARFMNANHSLPNSVEEFTKIYGIGHYTASAYLSLHADIHAVLVDSNIARWLGRMTGQSVPVNLRNYSWVWDIATKLTPMEGFRKYNYAVLDFTIRICRPRKPLCDVCPLTKECVLTKSLKKCI